MSTLQLSRLARYHKLCDRLKDTRNPASPALFCRQWRCLGRYEQQLRLAGLGGMLGLSMALKPPALSAQCLPQDMEFPVNTYTTSVQREPAIAMDANGDFVITWHSYGQDGFSYGIYAQRYNAAGLPQGSEFKVNTYTTSLQRFPSIAMDANGDFVIAWQSFGQDGSSDGIYAQRYDANGMPIDSEFPVNTYTTSTQNSPAIAMDANGNFVIAWQSEGQDGDSYGIYAQRYDGNGMPVDSEFLVNTYTTSFQALSDIAMDANGNFVITWHSGGQDGSLYGIYAQQYNAGGIPQGSEFPVNTYTTANQREPAISMDANGIFVITWQSSGQDGSEYGIYAQSYTAGGVPQGPEFPVNTYTTDTQGPPAISMDADGDFVITWHSFGQDGSSRGIYAQRYNANGTPQGSEFPVNTYTTSSQREPAIAMDANGNFVIAWQSFGQDGSDYGIYAQRYTCPDPVDPDPIPTLSQWGVILLGLLMGIFGVVGIKQRKSAKV